MDEKMDHADVTVSFSDEVWGKLCAIHHSCITTCDAERGFGRSIAEIWSSNVHGVWHCMYRDARR